LVLTPYVLETDDDARQMYEKKMKEREEFAQLYYGGKIQKYNPSIDYSRKAGPISSMLKSVDAEMKKPENGGPGGEGDTVITPEGHTPVEGGEPKGEVPGEDTLFFPESPSPAASSDADNEKNKADEEENKREVIQFGPDSKAAALGPPAE
jgi:hypothetical protein